MQDKDFESIIPTAILTAYPRILTDIPYAQEMFKELSKENIPENLLVSKLAPEIEARFKLISKLLKQSEVHQILEIAAGYSTRGIELTKNDSQIIYAEMDLPQVVSKKTNLIKSFSPIPDNLHIIPGNALNEQEINKCEQFFDKKFPIAITNEGLLRYLNFDEKRQIATNIFKLLSKFGGVWITCDFTPKKFIANQDANLPEFNKNLTDVSDRNNSNWRFEDIDHVKDFLSQVGLKIESVHPFDEVKSELTSPKVLGLDDGQTGGLLKDAIVTVVSLNNKY